MPFPDEQMSWRSDTLDALHDILVSAIPQRLIHHGQSATGFQVVW